MNVRNLTALFILLWLTGLAHVASAHEMRPASLSLEQVDTHLFNVTWRVPARGDMRLSLYTKFDAATEQRSLPTPVIAAGYYTERWQISHPNSLVGSTIKIDGLSSSMTDAMIRISWLDGREQLARLLPDNPSMVVEETPGNGRIAATYFTLGVEHILLGIDHLLFVLALVVLVSSRKHLVLTITAFTLAHSLTLAAAVLGVVSVPQGPVEAVIALSIVFVAAEIIYQRRGHKSLAIRKPWLVAFGFGLLHGLGFAGALTEIGIPEHAIPLSLALFNVGVEAGQLLFIAAISGVMLLLRQLPPVHQWEIRAGSTASAASALPVAYLVGALATWWLIDRTLALVLL